MERNNSPMGLTRMMPWTWTPWFFRRAVNSFTPGQRTWKSNSWKTKINAYIHQAVFFLDKHNNTDLLSRNSAVPPAEWEAESRVRSPEWTFRWTGLPGRPPASGRSHLRRRSKVEISNIPDEHAAGVVSLVRVSPVGLLKAISLSFTAVITG